MITKAKQSIHWIVRGILLSWMLSGCVLLATPTPTPSIPATIQPTAAPTAVEPTAAPSPTSAAGMMTLTMWVPEFLNPNDETTGAAVLNEQLLDFGDIFPGTQVRVIPKKATGAGGLYDLLRTASEAAPSILPDLILLNQDDLKAATEAGLIQPMGAWLPEETDFYGFALDAASIDPVPEDEEGPALWGLPYVAQGDQIVYREGISETPPLSWTQVLTSGYSVLFPVAPPDDLAPDVLVAAYLGSGGQVMDEEGRASLDRAVLEDLYGFFDSLRTQELINVDRALSLSDAAACWEIYQQGVGRLSPVPMGAYWVEPPEGSLPGWMPTADGAPLTLLHSWHMAVVTPDPERQKRTLELVQWLSSPTNMGDVARATRLVPTRQRATESWADTSESIATLERILSTGVEPLDPTVDTAVRRALQLGLDALYRAEVNSPEAAADYALNRLRP